MPTVERGLRAAVRPPARMVRLMLGLVLCGTGIGFMVDADLGVAPWSVLDQGISRQTGITVGTSTIVVSAVVLLLWIPLKERPGVGTIANAVTIGLVTDLTLSLVSTPDHTAGRVAFMAVGVFLFGPGSGLYIGARLGPGPRDGLMTGLHRKGIGSVRLVRTGLELTALGVGFALGGTVGIGTLAFALTVGPNVQFFLKHLTMPDASALPPPGTPRPEERGPARPDTPEPAPAPAT